MPGILKRWLCFSGATRNNDYKKYKEYALLVDCETARPSFLRGLLTYKRNPIPLEEVEPVEEIMKRFVTGAMSYGSISKEAHEALAIAMNRIGGRSNTGEGGEDPTGSNPWKMGIPGEAPSSRWPAAGLELPPSTW